MHLIKLLPAGTSFTVGVDVAPTANPLCFSYKIVN